MVLPGFACTGCCCARCCAVLQAFASAATVCKPLHPPPSPCASPALSQTSCSTDLQARRCILVASSPEILCRVDSARVITNRPLAGTRPRGSTDEQDRALEADLLADEKEKAEHIMLVDLGRNDVGRVAQAGTVSVDKLMAIERYSHVMHISSTVTGATLLRSCVFWAALALCALPVRAIAPGSHPSACAAHVLEVMTA